MATNGDAMAAPVVGVCRVGRTSRSPARSAHNARTPAHMTRSSVGRRTGNNHEHPTAATSRGKPNQHRAVSHHAEPRRDNPMVLALFHQRAPHRHRCRRPQSRTAHSAGLRDAWRGVQQQASRSTDQVSHPRVRGARLGSFHLSPSERPFSIAPFRVSVLQLRRGPGKNENRTLRCNHHTVEQAASTH